MSSPTLGNSVKDLKISTDGNKNAKLKDKTTCQPSAYDSVKSI